MIYSIRPSSTLLDSDAGSMDLLRLAQSVFAARSSCNYSAAFSALTDWRGGDLGAVSEVA
eukprot:scaffold42_cov133-Cylindrotheca_fusiformis.AAC.9